METRKHLLAVVAFACSLCGFATDYYVDAVNGNDANSGLEGSPKESFAALFKAYSIKSGDKVHAAAGIYTNGVMKSGSNNYRIIVPAGVEIIGAGADVTTIEGQAHTNELGETTLDASPWGCGANAIRGVYLNSNAILRNFTVTKGYTPNYSDQTGGGVLAAGRTSCYVVDCVVTNCVASRGALASVTAVRCRFANNRASTGTDIFSGAAFNCVFGNCLGDGYNVYQGAPYVNCTFYGDGKCMHVQSGAVNVIYNSLVLKTATGNNTIYTNCIYHADKGTKGGGSVYISSDAAAKVDANYRPRRDSPCLDVGDLDIYTNKFPAALADEMWADYLGNSRKVGSSVDAGACESPFATGVPFDWHVDAVNGSDANDGTSAEKAFQTLQVALANTYLRSGDTVHAAAGRYANGVVTSGNNRKYRAVVPVGVTLIGDAGAEQTVIVGAPDPEVALDASPYGCGTNAVQCVRLLHSDSSAVGATIRGFTLTGGFNVSYTNSASYGSAVYCGDDRANIKRSGCVLDCIVTNNCAARGAGVLGATAIRCAFADNRVRETGCDVYVGNAYNCLFGNVVNTSSYNFYGTTSSRCVNCTFVGTGWSGGMNALACGFYNCLVLKNVARQMILTNCVYTGTLESSSSAGNSRKVASVEAVHLDESYRPLRNSPVLDKGNVAYYTLPDAVADEAGYDFLKAARVQGLGIDIGALESSESLATTHWYVNAETGSDLNDGETAATAFKTLAAAMANEKLAENDVVNVAAGTYSDGEMTVESRKFRAVVPAGVTLLGAGADRTIIEGAEDHVNGTEGGHWCGANAIACVKLNAGSIIRGVTLTKGHTPAWESGETVNWGGAVVASGVNNAAYVVDCVLTNNFAGRGAGLYQGTAIRCRFNGNGVRSTGTDIMQGNAYNCIFGDIVNVGQDSVYQGGQYVNCVFYGDGYVSHASSGGTVTNIWNSIVLRSNPGTGVKLVNCATIASSGYSYGETSITLTQGAMMLDENYAPRTGSPLIDRGRNDLYAKFPADVADTLAKTDFAGSQRVYNGTIDIGAFEYDWRDDFAKTLKRSQVEVVSASATVVTNGTRSLTVPTDASIEIDWSVKADGQHSFYVVAEGEGSVSVTCGGEALAPAADGLCTFIGVEGETRRIVVSCSDGASAVLRDFRDFGGFVISFR